ncbi:MAG: hypothetical protein JSR59_20455 [Proteobacteria bacterium]|nr:hypothetical protein [Pseudomonadota bacterium]
MSLKFRLALVVMLLMAALVASYSLLLFGEMRERADTETQGALPWVVALLPTQVGPGTPADAERELVALMQRLQGIRHVRVTLYDPASRVLARAPLAPEHVPGWLERELPSSRAVRKAVLQGDRTVAVFEVVPATSDELAELWEDFLRSSLLVVSLSLAAATLIVWFTLRALRPVDRIRGALRDFGAGVPVQPLPEFQAPEMNDIAQAFNRMTSAIDAAQQERANLMRRLVESEERTRRTLAHDLHDELSPYLVALQPLTGLLEARCNARPELGDLADSVRTLSSYQSRILSTLREILTGLHPPELTISGLQAALEQMLVERSVGGIRPIDIDLEVEGDLSRFGPTVDVSIYRMVQECVTNAQRHCAAPHMRIAITVGDATPGARRWVQIDAANDGVTDAVATPQRRQGLGTLGMRERSIALGGTFEAGPSDGAWHVRIRLPVDAVSEDEEEAA